jgi:L-lysine exporter family protein LysE/ArgO
MLSAALSGLLLSLGLILPLGAQNTFVFLQGATQPRWRQGLPVVITAALCDTTLILLAVSGVSLLVLQLPWLQTALRYGGVLFLLYMGWTSWRSQGALATEGGADWPLRRQVLFSLSVSLLNPHAILDTVGVIGTTALSFPAPMARAAYTGACILVSWTWFFGLFTAGHLLRRVERTGRLNALLGKISALVIWGVALKLLAGALG